MDLNHPRRHQAGGNSRGAMVHFLFCLSAHSAQTLASSLLLNPCPVTRFFQLPSLLLMCRGLHSFGEVRTDSNFLSFKAASLHATKRDVITHRQRGAEKEPTHTQSLYMSTREGIGEALLQSPPHSVARGKQGVKINAIFIVRSRGDGN